MAQQMVNGSYYHGDITVTNRMTDRYAVVGDPFHGAHLKPRDEKAILRRKIRNKNKKLTIKKGVLVKEV